MTMTQTVKDEVKKLVPWSTHPGVRKGKDLTLGERAADKVRNGMGSWFFVITFIGIMIVWAAFNSIGLHNSGFDPYPYILLNLMLSMMAGLQGAILLIAAKRADSVSAEVANHTLKTTQAVQDLLVENTNLTGEIRKISGEVADMTKAVQAHIMETASHSQVA